MDLIKNNATDELLIQDNKSSPYKDVAKFQDYESICYDNSKYKKNV